MVLTGTGTAHGAVSLLNAIGTGLGGAWAIDLSVKVAIRSRTDATWECICMGPDGPEDDRVVKAVGTIMDPAQEERGWEVRVDSAIPGQRGLKSSSAVAVAAVRAWDAAQGLGLDLPATVERAISASRHAGVTITGAFDDTWACAAGGAWLTDNLTNRVTTAVAVPRDLEIAIAYPTTRIPTEAVDIHRYAEQAELSQRALSAYLADDLIGGLTLNSQVVERAAGLPPTPLVALREAGAKAAGYSGTGPAITILYGADDLDAIRLVAADHALTLRPVQAVPPSVAAQARSAAREEAT